MKVIISFIFNKNQINVEYKEDSSRQGIVLISRKNEQISKSVNKITQHLPTRHLSWIVCKTPRQYPTSSWYAPLIPSMGAAARQNYNNQIRIQLEN